MAELDLTNISNSSISTPAAGVTAVFVDTDAKLKSKDSTGQVSVFSPQTAQSIATAGGTTTLTNLSQTHVIFTGLLTQICILPDATTLNLGYWFEITNNSLGIVTVKTNGSAVLYVVQPGISAAFTCTSIDTTIGTWNADVYPNNASLLDGGALINDGAGNFSYGETPVIFNKLDIFGHSFFDMIYGLGNNSPWVSSNGNILHGNQFASFMGGNVSSSVTNHARVGAGLTFQGRAGGGFATVISEIQKPNTHAPFTKSGGASLICYGINDVGNNTAANQATMRTSFSNCLNSIISRWRASAIFPANTGKAQWTFGANFSNSTAANKDWNSGFSVLATVVDSAGSSTATFTIPFGYKGEPIAFQLVGNSTANACTVTWGGTVTGTTSIIGTTTVINATTIDAHGLILVRFTNATNGLTAANAGQTITVRITAVTGGTFELDSAWIESFKPAPVVIINCPRPACKVITYAFGDGVTNTTTTFTSASAVFSNTNNVTDIGGNLIETDAQGSIPGSTTVSAVGSATSITLSQAATSSKTSVQFTVGRSMNAYKGNYTTNTNFSAATPASHAAADTDVTNLNTTIASVVASWDSMVQLVDLDTAIGGDSNLPSNNNIYSWYAYDGLHLNDYGEGKLTQLILNAFNSLKPLPITIDGVNVGLEEMISGGVALPAIDRRIINSGQVYTAENTTFGGAAYTAVVGDMYAIPFYITESSQMLTAIYVEQTNAPATAGSSVRVGIYDDFLLTGYPQNLRWDFTSGGAVALGTTAAMKTIASTQTYAIRQGLYWLVVKVDVLGTNASTLRTITGPNKYMPNWAVGGGVVTPIGWKATAVTSPAALPGFFPTGATLVSTAPAIGVAITIL